MSMAWLFMGKKMVREVQKRPQGYGRGHVTVREKNGMAGC